jgi:hypothetical protein
MRYHMPSRISPVITVVAIAMEKLALPVSP